MTGTIVGGSGGLTDNAGYNIVATGTPGMLESTIQGGTGGGGVGTPNLRLNRAGSGQAGDPATSYGCYISLHRFQAAQLGSITINVGQNGVLYNTTSDKRLKTLTRPVDGDEALDKVAAMQPMNLRVYVDADGRRATRVFRSGFVPGRTRGRRSRRRRTRRRRLSAVDGRPFGAGSYPRRRRASVNPSDRTTRARGHRMSYSSQAALSGDADFINRVSASAAVEAPASEHPVTWAREHVWRIAAAPGFAAAYESALVAGVPRPGNDPAVITDGQILSAVQAELGVT